MRIAILSSGDGWHVRDLQRAARLQGHEAEAADFRDDDGVTDNQSGYERIQLGPSFDSGCLLDDDF